MAAFPGFPEGLPPEPPALVHQRRVHEGDLLVIGALRAKEETANPLAPAVAARYIDALQALNHLRDPAHPAFPFLAAAIAAGNSDPMGALINAGYIAEEAPPAP